MRGNSLVMAVLAGIVAFVITYVVLLIIAAILDAVGVREAGAIVTRFAWIISMLVGIVTGWQRYEGGSI